MRIVNVVYHNPTPHPHKEEPAPALSHTLAQLTDIVRKFERDSSSLSSGDRHVLEKAANSLPSQLREVLNHSGSSSSSSSVSAPVSQTPSKKPVDDFKSVVPRTPVHEDSYRSGDWREQPQDWFLTKRQSTISLHHDEAPPSPVRYEEPPASHLQSTASLSAFNLHKQPERVVHHEEVYEPPQSTHPAPDPRDWRAMMKYKKEQEVRDKEAQEEAEKLNFEKRFDGMPEWKRKLLIDMDKKKYEAEAPLRDAARAEQEKQAWFNSLPGWKQQLLVNKQQQVA